jgi:hypothetical protein
MGVHKKGGLVGGFDQLRAPDAPTISVSGGEGQVTVTITNPSDTGGGDITSYAVSALTGPIEDTTFAVTVVSDGGNKYAIDGTTQATLTLYKGHTYIFDQSDSSNSSHPLRLSTTSNGSHGGGSEYTTGVTTSGTPGSAGAFTKIAIATDAPDTLYYYCTNHSGMGGTANLKTSLQGGASGSSSPVTVSSLTNDEAYNVRASAINAFGQSPYSDATSATPSPIPRGLFAGGNQGESTIVNVIEFVDISTDGNASDFGDLSASIQSPAACSSSSRGVFSGGSTSGGSSSRDTIEYVTIATEGNVTDFGDLSAAKMHHSGLSNSTRGIFTDGRRTNNSTNYDQLVYITIASTGNSTDFGEDWVKRGEQASFASPTRGIIGGGHSNGTYRNHIAYVTIASTGNAASFGDLANPTLMLAGASSTTRGLFGGGYISADEQNVIQYITIASTGNTTDFGDLTAATSDNSASSNSVKAVFAGGYVSTYVNTIDKVTIATTGNASDFGDLTNAKGAMSKGQVSPSHGGIS